MNTAIPARLATLRHVMRQHGIAACLIPTADPHLSEYLPTHWSAREWLSGFTGSAGILLVTQDDAGVWTDSRYFEQAEKQLAGTGIVLQRQRAQHASEHLRWLQERLCSGDVLAVAGDSLSEASRRHMEAMLAEVGAQLRIDLDLPAQIWTDRPALPRARAFEHGLELAGTPRSEKFARVREHMCRLGATHHFLSSLDDIAWLCNLRGSDVACNPVFLAHLLIETGSRAILFIERSKLDDATTAALASDGIELVDYACVTDLLGDLGDDAALLYDPARVVTAIVATLSAKVRRIEQANPSTYFKALKTPHELAHIREVMRHDGAALIRAFRRLEDRLRAGMRQTELDVDRLLHEERAKNPAHIGESFSTIAGYMANGALPHYRATAEAHSELAAHGLLLVDSGGQYLGGTTDITRVLALGDTTDEQRRDATRVLKGMIALSRTRFPKGSSGPQLDAIARAPLWANGMDYGHGTGHGVGFFLNVHEGPQSLRPPVPGGALVPLEPGMIVSIEPGLYKSGRYGIRHENLVLVTASESTEFGDFHAFETLTLCPFDRRALEPSLLNAEERAWLDDYHVKVWAALAPLLDGADLQWLERHCAPLMH